MAETKLVKEVIGGKPATVAYLTEIGGEFTTPDLAKIAIARFKDGTAVYFQPSKNKAPRK